MPYARNDHAYKNSQAPTPKRLYSLQSSWALQLHSIRLHTMSIVVFQHQALQPCSLAILNLRSEGMRKDALPCVTQHYAAIHADAVLMHLMLLHMEALIANSQSLRAQPAKVLQLPMMQPIQRLHFGFGKRHCTNDCTAFTSLYLKWARPAYVSQAKRSRPLSICRMAKTSQAFRRYMKGTA